MTTQVETEQLTKLLLHRDSHVVLTTVSPTGETHTTGEVELLPGENETYLYREYLESSPSAHDLTYALWHEKPVAFLVMNYGRHLHLLGRPVRTHITGPLYQREYEAAEARGADELASVWEIHIDQIADESPALLRAKERELRPFFTHLDRLLKSA